LEVFHLFPFSPSFSSPPSADQMSRMLSLSSLFFLSSMMDCSAVHCSFFFPLFSSSPGAFIRFRPPSPPPFWVFPEHEIKPFPFFFSLFLSSKRVFSSFFLTFHVVFEGYSSENMKVRRPPFFFLFFSSGPSWFLDQLVIHFFPFFRWPGGAK